MTEAKKDGAMKEPTEFRFIYRNWRGEVGERRVLPERVVFGSTEWHPEPQWLLCAYDLDKDARRDFALKDIAFGTFGPYGYLIKPDGLAEDDWYLADDPSENSGETSVALYALEEQQLGSAAPQQKPRDLDGVGWRVGRHYSIHVYEGERPVATFHRAEDAKKAVDAVNAAPQQEPRALGGVEALRWALERTAGKLAAVAFASGTDKEAELILAYARCALAAPAEPVAAVMDAKVGPDWRNAWCKRRDAGGVARFGPDGRLLCRV